MKLYVLVEGDQTEKRVHKGWLSHWFPRLEFVAAPEQAEAQDAAAFLISGNGYPSYCDRIEKSLEDLERFRFFDWFIVIVDSEEMSVAEKRAELDKISARKQKFSGSRFVIQNRCIETWLLANTKLVRAHAQSEQLRKFQEYFDVRTRDPEELPGHADCRNVAETHFLYLRAAFAERNMSYTKKFPRDAVSGQYMRSIWERHLETGHVPSFRALVDLYLEMSRRFPELTAGEFPQPSTA